MGSPANADNSNNVRNVNTDGTINNNNAYNGNNGLRPDLVKPPRLSKEYPEDNGMTSPKESLSSDTSSREKLTKDGDVLQRTAPTRLGDYGSLYRAYRKTLPGKRWKTNTVLFEKRALLELYRLKTAIETDSYKQGPFNVFDIKDPKPRTIKSINFTDKVVQQAICDNIIAPVLDPKFIFDSYACRKDKGTHAALDRARKYMRHLYQKHGLDFYILSCDVSKYFDSIDHEILKEQMARYFNGPDLAILEYIIDSVDGGKGLPLGLQTSQWFSIAHLNDLDQQIKSRYQTKFYVRYMDDFFAFSHDRKELERLKKIIVDILRGLKLTLNPKSQIVPAKNGLKILGKRLHFAASGKLITKADNQNIRSQKRKLRKYKEMYAKGQRTKEQIIAAYQGWRAYASQGHTKRLIAKMDKLFIDIFKEEEHGAIIEKLAKWSKSNRPWR